MKKLSFPLLLCATILSLQACNNNTSSTSSTDSTNTAESTRMADSVKTANNNMNTTTDTSKMVQNTGPVAKDVSDFVMKAGSAGMKEVQLGQLAQQKAQSDRVKNFAQMMVTDHSKANDELKSLASSKNITLPSTLDKQDQKEMDKLNSASGSDFDKEYMRMMVKGHEKVLADFKAASTSLSDPAFKDFAAKTAPVIQMHLDSAKAISMSDHQGGNKNKKQM